MVIFTDVHGECRCYSKEREALSMVPPFLDVCCCPVNMKNIEVPLGRFFKCIACSVLLRNFYLFSKDIYMILLLLMRTYN